MVNLAVHGKSGYLLAFRWSLLTQTRLEAPPQACIELKKRSHSLRAKCLPMTRLQGLQPGMHLTTKRTSRDFNETRIVQEAARRDRKAKMV
jgi:hypothetical protein